MDQQWPAGLVIGGPEATIVGWLVVPSPPATATRSRHSSTDQRRSPRSRTVVTPALACLRSARSMTPASSASS
jgi:hypothetical protein